MDFCDATDSATLIATYEEWIDADWGETEVVYERAEMMAERRASMPRFLGAVMNGNWVRYWPAVARKEATPASRGENISGVNIHSVRLPGLLAHQEVILGGAGQTLSIRHDTINRECYMPGVILAIKEVVKRPGLVYGLDKILGL